MNRVLHFAASAIAALFLATPMAAQVGKLPEQSPFRDLDDGQRFGVTAGYLSTSRDVLGVGPESGPIAGLRYDLYLGGPAYFTARAFGLSSERNVLDASKNVAQRRVGTQSARLLDLDASLRIALTGERTWHSIQPDVQLGVGFVSALGEKVDVGGYSFGPKFSISSGFGVRWVTGRNSELRADLGWFFWQVNYPSAWRQVFSPDGTAIRATGTLTPWMVNRAITAAWTWGIFR